MAELKLAVSLRQFQVQWGGIFDCILGSFVLINMTKHRLLACIGFVYMGIAYEWALGQPN